MSSYFDVQWCIYVIMLWLKLFEQHNHRLRSTSNMESLVVYEDIGENSISFVSATCKNNIQKAWIGESNTKNK